MENRHDKRQGYWVALSVSHEEFIRRIETLQRNNKSFAGECTKREFCIYYLPQGYRPLMRLMIFVKPFQLFRLKGFVQGERLFYQFVGSVAYVNRNNVRRTLQEKLYELCSPSEDQE